MKILVILQPHFVWVC